MAKVIKYKFLSAKVNHGTEERPNVEQIFLEKTMGWNEANEEIAKREAYNGAYTIEEVEDQTEQVAPTIEERTAALEEALTLLLEGATE